MYKGERKIAVEFLGSSLSRVLSVWKCTLSWMGRSLGGCVLYNCNSALKTEVVLKKNCFEHKTAVSRTWRHVLCEIKLLNEWHFMF